jgi:very-short-patch-repair endonuclease
LGKKSYFFADFYCHRFKTIVEIDGKIHRNLVEYDKERTTILNAMGYQVMRFKNEDVIKNWGKVELELENLFFSI